MRPVWFALLSADLPHFKLHTQKEDCQNPIHGDHPQLACFAQQSPMQGYIWICMIHTYHLLGLLQLYLYVM